VALSLSFFLSLSLSLSLSLDSCQWLAEGKKTRKPEARAGGRLAVLFHAVAAH
jgi:hypothetical protein